MSLDPVTQPSVLAADARRHFITGYRE